MISNDTMDTKKGYRADYVGLQIKQWRALIDFLILQRLMLVKTGEK